MDVLPAEVQVTVAVTCVGAVGHHNLVAVGGGIDTVLDQAEGIALDARSRATVGNVYIPGGLGLCGECRHKHPARHREHNSGRF